MAQPNLQKLQTEAADYHRRGHFEQAEERYHEILRLIPDAAEIHNALGAALVSLKRLKEAAEAFGRSVALEPSNEHYRYNYANALKELGSYQQSAEQFAEVVRINPDLLIARIQLGLLYMQLEQWREATEQFNQVCKQKPDMAEAFERLGFCLLNLWRYADAENVFKHALQITPNSVLACGGLAEALMGLNKAPEAVKWMRKAAILAPDNHKIRVKLGRALIEAGNQQEAIEIFEELIRLRPNDVSAYLELALIHRFGEQDTPRINQVEHLLKVGGVNQHQISETYFALGKMYDDIGLYDEAFIAYSKGGSLYMEKQPRDFDMVLLREELTAICSSYTKNFFSGHSDIGHDSEVPVFIVGMPRSGTTLTEQILASHSQVAGAGEVNFWHSSKVMLPIELATDIPYPECIGLLQQPVVLQIAEKYLTQIQELINHDTASRIVDKMPQNFFFLGLIAIVFPKAKIIHIQRDAMDTCLSIYFQKFKEAHLYAYNLEHLGHYYKEYERLMQHWREVLPIKMLEIKYEDLVADQERVTREMINYIGLPWDERCLQPEKSNKVVRTASLWQARQPVYKTSVARWKNYEKHLQPLKDALGYEES
ncbi:MAG: sulfotransferase [Methylophilales bacterium]|nr:sulfotransferase [Methylophilales bacterium]